MSIEIGWEMVGILEAEKVGVRGKLGKSSGWSLMLGGPTKEFGRAQRSEGIATTAGVTEQRIL